MIKVVDVDRDRCVNCHQCIAVCPVKYCNNGVGQYIKLDESLCIGCGECLIACTHNARLIIDDFDLAMRDLQKKEKIIAFISPSTATNFPHDFLRLNGWLKSLGVEAFFDVSFGAELTIKSYIEHLKRNNPKMIIAQPCPVIVNYIEFFKPELLKYLAPVDSPMMHAMKMVKEFYPQYKDYKFLIVSPCIAKKREFEEVGLGDYNVTITKIKKYLQNNKINLDDYPEIDFDNDPAERAVLFSSPGGLLATAQREIPEINLVTRKIEGVKTIYRYLDKVEDLIDKELNPVLIDCLSCELGCNGGTGTDSHDKSPDELEYYINERSKKMKKLYHTDNGTPESVETVRKTISKYWKPGLYDRTYEDKSYYYKEGLLDPTEEELQNIYKKMKKFTDTDIQNCPSCGYNSCEHMAKAIYNNLNRVENCHLYMNKTINEYTEHLSDLVEKRTEELRKTLEHLQNTQEQLIESEKMAALGQLISGIAHEINTPLGAIRSSNENISDIVSLLFKDFEEFHIKIPGRFFASFNNLLNKAYSQKKNLSMKEERKEKRRLISLLEEKGIDDAYYIAEELIEMGIFDGVDEFFNLLNSDEGLQYFHLGYNLISLFKSSHNITTSVDKASKVVFALKRFAHFNVTGEPVLTNIAESLDTVLTLYHNKMKHGVEVVLKYNDVEDIIAFPDELNQVWTNLISNSLQAMDYKGKLSILVKKAGDFIEVRISDTGPGIPGDIKDRIFEPFFTTKPQGEGSGLGLDIVKKIIANHRGSIDFDSSQEGTTFIVKLPVNLKEILESEK